MSKKDFSWFLLAGCMFILTHVAPAAADLGVNRVVTLHEEDNGAVIHIRVDTYICVELSGIPTSGYWWYNIGLDQEFLEVVKEETRNISPQEIDGGRILGIWLLRVKRAGTPF